MKCYIAYLTPGHMIDKKEKDLKVLIQDRFNTVLMKKNVRYIDVGKKHEKSEIALLMKAVRGCCYVNQKRASYKHKRSKCEQPKKTDMHPLT